MHPPASERPAGGPGSPPPDHPDLAPPAHPALAPLAWLLGTWRGTGVGGWPGTPDFAFGQQVVAGHDGRGVLSWESRSWALDPDTGAWGRPLAREAGFWRAAGGDGEDPAVELVLAHSSGVVEVWLGALTGTRAELATDAVVRLPSAGAVTGGRRLYGLVGDELMWAYDMATAATPLRSHLSARLRPV